MSSTIQTIDIAQGQVSKIINIYIENTAGNGLTGLLFNTASLAAHFLQEGDTGATAITLAAGTLGTYGSGHFKEIDSANMPGCYQFGVPDGVFPTGDNSAKIMLKGAASMADCIIDVNLTKFDYNNGRMDLKSTGLDQVVIETGLNARESMSLCLAALVGKLSGAGTNTISIKNADGSTLRIFAGVDANGNRLSVTLTPS